MILPSFFIIIGSSLDTVGAVVYLKDMIKGRAQPNKATWLLWSFSASISFVSSVAEGLGIVSVLAFVAVINSLIVLIPSFFLEKGYWKLEPVDYFMGLFSLLAIILWVATNDPFLALVFSIIADAFAYVPTYRKSWSNPESESLTSFCFGALAGLVVLLSLPVYSLEVILFPAYILIGESGVVITLLVRSRSKDVK